VGSVLRIGIVTPAFNAAATLGDTIRSVIVQTHDDWRMIVVDDGSCDATLAAAAKLPDARLTIISQAHQGVSAARNRGIGSVRADAYLFLDADDQLAPDALAVLAATLDDCPWAGAAVGAYRFTRGSGPARRTRAPVGGNLVEALLRRNRFVNGGHVLIRSEAIEAAGGFNPALTYGEDWEFWVRIALTGEFAATRRQHPLLHVRQRPDGAYARLAADPGSFQPCMRTIFCNPALKERLGSGRTALLQRAAEAENAWVVGREMIRHGHAQRGVGWLVRSVRLWPTVRRLVLLAAVPLVLQLPQPLRGALRSYAQAA